jgi:hypothetical protein
MGKAESKLARPAGRPMSKAATTTLLSFRGLPSSAPEIDHTDHVIHFVKHKKILQAATLRREIREMRKKLRGYNLELGILSRYCSRSARTLNRAHTELSISAIDLRTDIRKKQKELRDLDSNIRWELDQLSQGLDPDNGKTDASSDPYVSDCLHCDQLRAGKRWRPSLKRPWAAA